MASLLYVKPLVSLSPDDAFALKKAEMDIHEAAISLANEVHETMPEGAQSRSDKAAVLGLLSAAGRLLARLDPAESQHLIAGLPLTMAIEQAHWTGRKNFH